MSYIVFARKWRPQNFDEIVSQKHIATTLKNAISLNRVAHAYLFSGPRGIGKTSTARVLAKALNCQNGPTVEPCNKCASCQEITEGRSLDCIEIDGASNRGIEEVRALRENVRLAPAKGKYKVYIIDEVHMLTNEAFNALLKTLEEPPAHVKFVFATTQPHKVPTTILSRCQRFDFHRIPLQDIVEKLKRIAKEEKIEVEKEALFSIAKSAEGSMRDAESILDELISFCNQKITVQDVDSMLGLVNQEITFGITQMIIDKDAKGAMKLLDAAINEGKDIALFAANLIEHFRNLLFAKFGRDLETLIDLPKEFIEKVIQQSQNFSIDELLYMFYTLTSSQETMKKSNTPRISLEIALLKLTRRDYIGSWDDILNRFSELEKKLQGTYYIEKPVLLSKKDESARETINTDCAKKEDNCDCPGEITFEQITERWPQLLDKMKESRISLSSYLSEGQPFSIKNNVLTIAFPKESLFYKEAVERAENTKLIEKFLNEFFNVKIKTSFIISDQIKRKEPAQMEGATDIDPTVKSALKILGGRIK